MSASNDTNEGGIQNALSGVQKAALTIGILASLAIGFGWTQDKSAVQHAYLHSYLFWLAPTVGSLSLYMLHQLTGGRWGAAIRRILEAGMRTIPFMALAFIPIVLWMQDLYPWARPDEVKGDALLEHKASWLNPSFFIVRAAAYFVIWFVLSKVMLGVSKKRDMGDHAAAKTARLTAGPGFLVYALTMTFASFDWAMSLEPHWFSTMYGAIFLVGQGLATMTFAIMFSAWLSKRDPFSKLLAPNHFHDLGTLTFAMVLLHAYTNFSQYLIIWSGNLNEETPWVHVRSSTSWQHLAQTLVMFHFFVPFFLLLSRKNKQAPKIVAGIAALLCLSRFLDIAWYIGPAFHPEGFHVSWIDLVMPFALGGLWVAFFVQMFKNRPLVSAQDLELAGSLQPAHH